MRKTTCFKEFILYSSLNILGMLGLSFYILADTYFVSKGLGSNGLAALNLAIPIYSFIHGSGLLFGMGGATKYSIFKSQGKDGAADAAFTTTVLLGLGCAAVFFVMGVFCSGTIAGALGADDAVFPMSKTYLQVLLLFAPMFILNNILLCFVRNDGAPKHAMLAMLGGSLSNILLDYVFIFPCHMGIFGAVLATGLAPIISMLILSPFFFQRKNRFHWSAPRLSRHLPGPIVSGGFPSLITEVSSGTVIIVFNAILLRLQGNMGVAAYGVIANLSLVVLALNTGIAQGVQPLISREYGAGHPSNVRALLRWALTLLLAVSVLVYAGIFLGAHSIVEIFNSEHHPLFAQIAVLGLKIYFTGCVFAGLNIILSIYFTATECALPAHIISLLRGFFLVIPMAFLLSFAGGTTGVWCAFPVTELTVSGIGTILYRSTKKRIQQTP